jgi:hypothetical protein
MWAMRWDQPGETMQIRGPDRNLVNQEWNRDHVGSAVR